MNYLKSNDKFFYDSIIMSRFGKTKVAKKKYGTKYPLNIWDFNVDNIVMSKLVKT